MNSNVDSRHLMFHIVLNLPGIAFGVSCRRSLEAFVLCRRMWRTWSLVFDHQAECLTTHFALEVLNRLSSPLIHIIYYRSREDYLMSLTPRAILTTLRHRIHHLPLFPPLLDFPYVLKCTYCMPTSIFISNAAAVPYECSINIAPQHINSVGDLVSSPMGLRFSVSETPRCLQVSIESLFLPNML